MRDVMIKLYTAETPNGYKASIMLEELGVDYDVHHVQLRDNEQKEDWYLEINPNGRIPAIVDEETGQTVFESGAILIYLAEKHGRFLASEGPERWETIQWLMFQMGGVGPMQGQANVFYRYAPEKIDYAIGRYQRETRRLYEVLDRRLSEAKYLAGDEFSIADIATYPWVIAHGWAGVSIDGLENVSRWLNTVGQREGVQRGMVVPVRSDLDEVDPDEMSRGVSNMLA